MSTIPLPRLARASVSSLPLYAPDVTACAIDLSDNTNLWGAPPAALLAIRDVAAGMIARYPSIYSTELGGAYLRYLGLRSAGVSIATGCGSDDVLDSTMRAFGSPGDAIAFSTPTFSMIPTFAQLNDLRPITIPLTAQFDVDAQRLVDARAKITYLCSPNNPTSTALSRAAVEYVVDHAHGIVVIDGAYEEFAAESFVSQVERSDRVIVTRTMSKAFGLAGLRVGFGVGSVELVRLIERARGPYKVNALAECASFAALDNAADGLDWVKAHVQLAIENRTKLDVALRPLGLVALASEANFLLVPSARATELTARLKRRGILVRSFANLGVDVPLLAQSGGAALRIGVGPWPMLQSLLDALAPEIECV